MLKVAIVEDDEQSALHIKSLLERYGEENDSKFKVTVFSGGINFISDYNAEYDLVFMDMDMPHMDGYETAKMLRKVDSRVALIFVADLAKYAIKGYDVDAWDFILKPLEYATFSVKLKKVIDRIGRENEKYLCVVSRNGIEKVYYSEIYYITLQKRHVTIHTKRGPIEMHVPMKQLEAKLKDGPFVRGDNSSMVNLMYVTSVNREGAIVNGQLILCSRNRRKALLDAFAHYLNL